LPSFRSRRGGRRRDDGFTGAADIAANAPWLLASRMRELGGRYERGAEDWAPFAITDARLVTGQNPASSALTADGVLAVLARAA